MGWSGQISDLITVGEPLGPRIVLGNDTPAELLAYYASNSLDVYAAQLWYYNETDFHFYLIGRTTSTQSPVVARGEYTAGDGVKEYDRYFPIPGGSEAWWRVGFKRPVRMKFGGLTELGATIPTVVEFLRGTSLILEQGIGGVQTGIADLIFGTVSAPRGYVKWAQATTDSPAIGTTETELLRTPFVNFRTNRAYAIEIGAEVRTSVAGTIARFRIRLDTAGGSSSTGQQIGGTFNRQINHTDTFGESFSRTLRVRNHTAADLEYDVVLTMLANANTVTALGGTAKGYYIGITDIGKSDYYPSYGLS